MLWLNMPRKKIPCPGCGQPMKAESQMCRQCKPTYERTEKHRESMSAALKGKPHNWSSGSTRPEVADKIRSWWTPERRLERTAMLLQRNPSARYHGLSSRAAAKLVQSVGHCQKCGSIKRLGIHHKDRNKQNQDPSNLIVLCHRCHMQDHAKAGETGWDSYWKKRKTNPYSPKACRRCAARARPRGTRPPCAPDTLLASIPALAGCPCHNLSNPNMEGSSRMSGRSRPPASAGYPYNR